VRQQNSGAAEDFILPYSAVYLRIQEWKNYWNRSTFAKVSVKIKVAPFLMAHGVETALRAQNPLHCRREIICCCMAYAVGNCRCRTYSEIYSGMARFCLHCSQQTPWADWDLQFFIAYLLLNSTKLVTIATTTLVYFVNKVRKLSWRTIILSAASAWCF